MEVREARDDGNAVLSGQYEHVRSQRILQALGFVFAPGWAASLHRGFVSFCSYFVPSPPSNVSSNLSPAQVTRLLLTDTVIDQSLTLPFHLVLEFLIAMLNFIQSPASTSLSAIWTPCLNCHLIVFSVYVQHHVIIVSWICLPTELSGWEYSTKTSGILKDVMGPCFFPALLVTSSLSPTPATIVLA